MLTLDCETRRTLGFKGSRNETFTDGKQGVELSLLRIKMIGRELWEKHGLLLVDPKEIVNDVDRQHLINIGNKVYNTKKK